MRAILKTLVLGGIGLLLGVAVVQASPGDSRERVRYEAMGGGEFKCPKGTKRIMQKGALGLEEYCANYQGDKNGYYLRWHKDGETWAVLGSFRDGKRHGKWIEFTRKGKKRRHRRYVNGRRQRRGT